mgnify:CR=1 FL=1
MSKLPFLAVIFATLSSSGCTASISTQERCWWCSQSSVTSCREYCATWSDDGNRCIKFRKNVSDHCISELLEEEQ